MRMKSAWSNCSFLNSLQGEQVVITNTNDSNKGTSLHKQKGITYNIVKVFLENQFSEILLISPLIFPDILITLNYNSIISLDRYGVWESFDPFLAIQLFGFIKHRTAFHNDCTEQNDI